ncbi:MAG: glycosyltransferase family 2 protein [Gaiellaceae bacterium]
MSATVVVPTWNGVDRIGRLLDSLAGPGTEQQVLVVDNGSSDGTARLVRERFPWVELLPLPENAGYSRAVNLAARRAEGKTLVLLNDDCVCEPGLVRRLAAALDPETGIVMAAAVLLEAARPGIIDSAGMELDSTLLVFDYLNGEPLRRLDEPPPPPFGPSAAAAAFDRSAFLGAGGFDEGLFAYWEDVDLVLRLRALGGRCALAPDARGLHVHSATLGAGSARKDYLTGFGRGYVLRKWGVLEAKRLPQLAARELAICAAQLVVDRTLAGARGRVAGFRAAAVAERFPYPREVRRTGGGDPLPRTLLRRARRRLRQTRRSVAS